ncbi:hypothetical protein LSCM4_07366 [Leishmania orientalis]|uniref:Uncharacterized protein n=1 Tax=Leishmania orientalis TaxID=2249476 RepID=A0A836HRV5_9TRYP|nr:hypothetical protein LSCM4_07366 [Leishmania orientalis]
MRARAVYTRRCITGSPPRRSSVSPSLSRLTHGGGTLHRHSLGLCLHSSARAPPPSRRFSFAHHAGSGDAWAGPRALRNDGLCKPRARAVLGHLLRQPAHPPRARQRRAA